MYLIILLFSFSTLIKCGKITPYGQKPIIPQYNNQNRQCSYTFSFFTETDLFSGDYIFIYFPSEYTAISSLSCSSYLLPEDNSVYTQLTSLSCSFISSGNYFKITSVELKGSSYSYHSIIVEGITNPNAGGTGNFKIETRRGDLNVLDYNHKFGSVGIVGDPKPITASSFTRSLSQVNDLSDYVFSITTLSLLPKNGSVEIFINSGDLVFTSQSQCSSSIGSGVGCNFTNNLYVLFYQLGSDKPIGTYTFTITKVQHPNYNNVDSSAIGTVTIRTIDFGTNTILDEKQNLQITNLQPGLIDGSTSKMWISNYEKFFSFSRNYILSAGDSIFYTLNFYTKNALPAGALIVVDFAFAPLSVDNCYASLGLEDISSTAQVSYSYVGNSITISNFKAIGANQLIGITFKANNPAASGAYTSLSIETYLDASKNYLVDSYPSGGFTINILNYLIFTKLELSFIPSSKQKSQEINAQYQFIFQLNTVNFLEDMTFELNFPSQFSFGAYSCTLTPNSNPSLGTACTISSNKLTISTGASFAQFSPTADNLLDVFNVNNPSSAGIYPIEFIVRKTSDSSIVYHQTLSIDISPADLVSASVTQASRDTSRPTVFMFKFQTSESIPSGATPYSFTNPTSFITFEFETTGGCANLFATDLGTGLATGSLLPCYGISNISPANNLKNLKCILTVGSPATVALSNYAEIPKTSNVEIHIPNIVNPACTTAPASITMYISKTVSRVTSVIYKTNTPITLPNALLNIITANPLNTAGSLGVSLNIAPVFVPDTVNSVSSIQILYAPASDKYLAQSTSSLILKFPPLPTTSPQSYLLESSLNIECYLYLNLKQTCYVYPEVGWILIYQLTNTIPVDQSLSLQDIIYIKNLINPPYAADMKSYLNIITIDSFEGSDTGNIGLREKENVIYTNFAAFSPGTASNVNVFGTRYEANQVNVEYNWVFILNDDIPTGGKILLKFPPNYYSLESDPLPVGTITSNNLNAIDSSQGFFSFLTNVATLSNFDGYTAGTLLTVKFTGVKNPQTEGLTIEFGIESQTPESYTIDSKNDISGVKIIAANSAGQISYNYFYTTPNNGYLLGNYYISFILQNSIPKSGIIEITFPLNFDSSSFKTYNGNNIECYISGPITLIDSCTLSSITITIVIFEDLEVTAGTPPVKVFIQNVYNYNTELDSGPVSIRTMYDNVILDDSGDSETNRKATTGLDASSMVSGTNFMNFAFEPKTESATAFYNITLFPIKSFNSDAILQFVFPTVFPRGLGDDISCSSQELQISSLDPLKCSVQNYVLNISNVNSYNATLNTGFTITLSGIVNPNIPNVDITSQIAFYIYSNENFVSEYTYGIGALRYTSAPAILYVANYIYSSNNTRVSCNYGFSFKTSLATAFSYISIDMPSTFGLQNLWDNKSYSLSLEGETLSQAKVIKNTIITSLTGSVTNNAVFMLNLYEIFNPISQGKSPFPRIQIYLQSSKEIVMKTYSNLIQYETPYFYNNGLIIILADDVDSIDIEAGTYSDLIDVKFPDTSSVSREISPISLITTGISVTPIICPANSLSTSFRIGINRVFSTSSFIIRWNSGNLAGYIPIKALMVNVKFNSNANISIPNNIEIPSGGRSSPIYIALLNPPFMSLTINLYINGYVPTFCNVTPYSLTFENGETSKPFWISIGQDSRGISGSVIMTLSGTNIDSYGLSSRKVDFIVSELSTVVPLMFQRGDILTGSDWVSVFVVMNAPCTIYYAVFVNNTNELDMGFSAIKAKKVPYDYFAADYWMGEFIQDISNYNYSLNITGLTPFRDYYLQVFVEGLNGVLSETPISLNFSTNRTFINPIVAVINILEVTTMTNEEIAALNTQIETFLGLSSSRFEANQSAFPNFTYDAYASNRDFPTRILQDNSTNTTNVSNITNITLFKIPDVVQNSLQLSILLLPELHDPNSMTLFQALTRLKVNLGQLISAFVNHTSAKINTTYGENGVFWYYAKIYSNDWNPRPRISKIWTNSVDVDNIGLYFPGKVYMIIVPTEIPLFESTRANVENSIRYLQVVTSNDTNTTNTTNTTVDVNTDNNTNSTTETNTSTNDTTINSGGWSIKFDNSTAFISINPNDSNISSETCETFGLNYLCIFCNGNDVQTPKLSRNDIQEYVTTQIPQPEQIKNRMDHMNRRALIYGSMNITEKNKGFQAHLELLTPGVNYTLYLVGEDNFEKQPNLMRVDQIIQINFTTPLIDNVASFGEEALKFKLKAISFLIFLGLFF